MNVIEEAADWIEEQRKMGDGFLELNAGNYYVLRLIKELEQHKEALKEAADILSDVYPTMDDAVNKYRAIATGEKE